MKRLTSLLLALCLASAPVLVSSEDETVYIDLDDSQDYGDEDEIQLSDEDDESVLPEGEERELTYGDSGDEVLEMQIRLSELSYYTGNLSGEFHESTRAALKAFQQDYGLEATGRGDSATLSVLYSAEYKPLKYGSTGDDVKKLQKRLMEYGYYTGKISGNFLEGTRNAVRDFQTKNSLSVSGEADIATQALLYSGSALGRTDKSGATATPAPTSSFLVDETAAQEVVPTASASAKFEKTLKHGSKGQQVKELQARLTELGYYTGPISGNFLGKTNTAVKKLQTQNALKADGIVTEDLWHLIFNDATVVLPQHTAKPTPEPTPVPFAITVDVRNQVTIVYGRDENGEYNVVVREMLCSTGKVKTPSDPGDWVLNGRHARWCYFPKWGGHAQYWTRINKNIAFHSVIYNTVNSMDLSVKSYKILGHRASHGCIRLTVADAKWIYDNIGEGTVVSIREDLPDNPELVASLKLPPLDYSRMLPQATPVPTASPEYISNALPPMPLEKMQKGDSGEDVYWLQCRLKELGYYTGKCSGTFLGATQSAVKAYQKDNGIYPSGVATEPTLKLLYAEALAAPTPSPAPIIEEISLPEEVTAAANE